MLAAISLGVYGLQAIFAAAVLGLSVTFVKNHLIGDAPATMRYAVFLGAYGLILAALGVASLFLEAIPSIIPVGFKAIGALLFVAGGIAWAVGLKGLSCSDSTSPNIDNLYTNPLLNQGCVTKPANKDYPYCAVVGDAPAEYTIDYAFPGLKSNCQKALADEVLMFVSFALIVALIVLGFLYRKRRGGSSSYVA
ncbi:hypothetical protein GQ53DRAFT_818449 [Thozetella sp. PMI_491]|nr:hypothetical protein GQ53DRAFT_818449 [Thozetella sp. PMI_491]